MRRRVILIALLVFTSCYPCERVANTFSPIEEVDNINYEDIPIPVECLSERLFNYREIELEVTFYSDEENEMEGGKYDRRGKILADYPYKVCAMPKDVPYGSQIEIWGEMYEVVDTGGMIKWFDEEKTGCKVDIFIPNKTSEWLNENTGKFYTTGKLYYDEES